MPHNHEQAIAVGTTQSDNELVQRALARDGAAFRAIMKRYNQRLYRIARGVVRNDSDAEDVVQAGYVRAFTHLDGFRGESSLATWLSRIVINEALGRLRQRRRNQDFIASSIQNHDVQIIQFPLNGNAEDPERTMAQRQILRLVEAATDKLPEIFRSVFMARVIEGLSVEETSELLELKPETVKTRLHRARLLVRRQLESQIGPMVLEAFPFAGRRCDRLSASVMKELGFED